MTRYGLESIKHHIDERSKTLSGSVELKKFKLPHDILKALKADPIVWKNFKKFPEPYKHIRIGWVDGARKRPDVFKKRLQYFIKMTAQNKKYGMVQ